MALKPTIYKLDIALSDLNRNYYDNIDLTLAQHPSETLERMMARVVAFCINAEENLRFTKGLSEVEEPDIWSRTLDDQVELWIDVGEPDAERIKKATRKASAVKVYCFNSKSDVWWELSKSKFTQLSSEVYRLDWSEIQTLAGLVQRTMKVSFTITGDSAYITVDDKQCEVCWTRLE